MSRKFTKVYIVVCGLGSVVGIATGYRLDGPGIESQWGRDFLHLSRPALGPTQPPAQWVPGLSPGIKSGRGVTLTPHPLLLPRSRKSRAIPLLPQWAVRPVQSLSACTGVHFFTFRRFYTTKSEHFMRRVRTRRKCSTYSSCWHWLKVGSYSSIICSLRKIVRQ